MSQLILKSVHVGLLLAALATTQGTNAAEISGQVTAVHDGDTFTIDGKHKIRVFGIDAPELRQECRADSTRASGPSLCVPCGDASRKALEGLVLGKQVSCQNRGQSYDRVVGECSVGDVQLGPWMLSHGFSVVYDRYLRKRDRTLFLGAQASAKRASVGLWAMTFIPPADWRNHKMRLECER